MTHVPDPEAQLRAAAYALAAAKGYQSAAQTLQTVARELTDHEWKGSGGR